MDEQTDFTQEPQSQPAAEAPSSEPPPPAAPTTPGPGGDASKKVAAGVLGILLGSLGIHKFYLGYKKEGIIMILVSLIGSFFTCGFSLSVVGIIGLVEGILYLTKSDEEFVNTYLTNSRPWF